ncbi:MAG: ABC transporter permease [Phototrophicaceae bacterium]
MQPPARWQIWLMLAPTLLLIGVLFFGGVGYALLQSLGWNAQLGNESLSFAAYRALFTDPRYWPPIREGIQLSLWTSVVSTALSAVLGVGLALLLRGQFAGRGWGIFALQFSLPIPHMVTAAGMLFLLSSSGLVARGAAALGWIQVPADFPILVRDRYGIGIILTYIWKETPFITLVVLAALEGIPPVYDEAAQTLGASWLNRLRYITLPLIAPSLGGACLLVLTFVFGAYEVPQLVGILFPRALPVKAVQLFLDPDLNARAEAMALSMLIALVSLGFALGYVGWARRRGASPHNR